MMNGKDQVRLALMLALTAAVVLVVQAQTGAAGAAAPAAKAGGKSLWDLWKVGGPVMWPIGLCSVTGIGLGVYGGVE